MVLAEIIGWDMVIVLAIIALLFGGAKLPKLARSLGSAKGEFEKGLKEGQVPAEAPADEKSAEQKTAEAKVAEAEARAAEAEAAAAKAKAEAEAARQAAEGNRTEA